MKPYLVHQTVHDERGPGHIAGVFQYGDGEEQKEDIGQEDYDAADAADDAVDNKGPQQAL